MPSLNRLPGSAKNIILDDMSLWLPFLRTADMWLRPRTELLDVETRWWELSAA